MQHENVLQGVRPNHLVVFRRLSASFLLLFGMCIAACSSPIAKHPTPVNSPQLDTPVSAGEYRINIGDKLAIKFFYNADLNENLTVRSDGRISMQLIGEMLVAGMTPAQLEGKLRETYGKVLNQPEVSVIVVESGGPKIYVDGEINAPGIHDLVGVRTLRHCIAKAGGVKDTARTQEVLVIRQRAQEDPLIVAINLEKINSGEDFSQDILLQPYDIVYVPRSPIANLNVWVRQYITNNLPFAPAFLFNR